MPDSDREAARLEQEAERLLKLTEETKRSVLQASYRIWLRWQAEQRRN